VRSILHSDDPVHVHSAASRYDGAFGRVFEPDEEGGYEVDLLGVRLHFEASELEFLGRPGVAPMRGAR
jgi:hypothetical protein